MITNRRTYYFHPEKIDRGIALLRDIRAMTIENTGRDFRGMLSIYGPVSVIVFDMRFIDEEDMKKFSSIWYPKLYEKNYIEMWFQNVKQMTSELWFLTGSDQAEDSAETRGGKVDGYWGKITHRFALQPYASCYDAAIEAAKEVQAKTKETFQKDLIVSQCYIGASNKIALEMDFEDLEQQKTFTDTWIGWLKEQSLFEALFVNFQDGSSEIWGTLD
jgi:hypothetical protein